MEEDLPSKWKAKQQQQQQTKKAGVGCFFCSLVAILISDKTDLKPTKIKRDKEGHYVMVKGSKQQELTILNI